MTTARFISPFMANGNIVEYLENGSHPVSTTYVSSSSGTTWRGFSICTRRVLQFDQPNLAQRPQH
ncbi:hypothetical protein M407DRAFT_31485 [Tulasnella calospora MUT 4182]|uniref:Uncharacterized protein n=1 Tax=Tulasnella calospora MUT 4182 TaxID=1051891 RepID=A0A0C3KBQ7_9AGAM|nr:hypothetical protein M407DRAFT_31485 [Tulasnella calospora MUT 4182]